MTMERNLTIRGDLAITPAELVENAATQAKLLMDIVEKTKCYQIISGKKYLQVEAWETIGAFNRVHAITKQMVPIMRDNEVIGYQADVFLLRDGIEVGGASMPCFFTENACKGKEGDAKHKASMSAAQTFATSKAYRMNYSYVAILAGYQPTPAEEMTGEAVDDRPANLEHWCEQHQTKWFKCGKMKGYAHPILNDKGKPTGEWCNEGEVDSGKTQTQTDEEPPAPVKQEPEKKAPETPASSVSAKPKRDPVTIKGKNDMTRACAEDFKGKDGKPMTQSEWIKEAGYKSFEDIGEPLSDIYIRIRDVKGQAP